MVGNNIGGDQVDWFVTGFYAARIGEAIYGFSDQDEDDSGGTITIMARSQIGDLADMLKTFPQMSYNEYMYERSIAQLQFMATDTTHTKYLSDKDKKIIENYNTRLKDQQTLEAFFDGFKKREKLENNE